MIDLQSYFARIGHDGSARPTIATLSALHARHPAAIPFENLDPLLGRPVRLDLPSLQAKLVGARRGGYCFEHNSLFKAVLEQIGFSVTSLAARVCWMAPPGQPPRPRTHMLLKVDLQGEAWLADVGFGGHLADVPLRFALGEAQETPSGVLRLTRDGGTHAVEARLDGQWRAAYRFTLEPHLPADYEMANWFTSTHPESLFRHQLLMERLVPGGRISLFNRRLTRRLNGRPAENTPLATPEAFAAVLATDFAVDPPADAAAIFARLPA